MIVTNISSSQIKRAEQLYPFTKLRGSITNGKSNIFGALGEIIIYDFFIKNGYNVNFFSTYNYDLIINDYKIDVKTKKTSVIPQINYLCSISSYNTVQKCDYYFFVRIKEDMKKGFLLGYLSKKEFFQKSIFKNKNDKDINGWKFKDDCYNIEISNLHKFSIK